MSRNGRWIAWLAPALLAACVDGSNPVAPEASVGTALFRAAAFPTFQAALSAAEAATLTRARVTVRDAVTDSVLAQEQLDIKPEESVWAIDVTFPVSAASPPRVQIEAELAAVVDAQESVEWSGRTAEFQASVSFGDPQVREVSMYRGPLANLDLTGLDVVQAPSSLLEGGSAQVSVALSGNPSGTRVYYESLDPAVATIDEVGRIRAVAPGSAKLVALAGLVADTVTVDVLEVVLPEPEAIQENVAPQVDYTAVEVASTLEDAAGAAAISTGLSVLATALDGGDGAAAVAAFEDAVEAWEAYGDGSNLRVLDGPQLSLVEITLIHAADALGIPFRQ